jgi:GGDEF domain-containing protein
MHGDTVGADIIRMTGERLAGILRSTDTIVRLGSCEFVLIIESVNNHEGVIFLNQKIMKKLGRRFALDGIGSISAHEKVTTARYPWDGVTLDALMSAAVNELDQSRILPRWVDALAAKLTDISPSQFATLRDTSSGTII